MKACLIKTLSIHVYVLEIGQRLVSRYRATNKFKYSLIVKNFQRVQLSLIQYIDNVSKHMIFILGKDGILFIDKIIKKYQIAYNI